MIRVALVAAMFAATGHVSGCGKKSPVSGFDGATNDDALGDRIADSLDGASRPDSGDGGGPADDSTTGTRLCDGSSGVRLAMASGGSGQIDSGSAMLGENGGRFLLVDGTCHAWVLADFADPLRELALSADQELALTALLKLDTWNTLMPPAGGGCADGPISTFRFGQKRLAGPACGVTAGSPWAELNDAFRAALTNLTALGTPVTGDVHYLIVRMEQNGAGLDSRPAATWPLSVSLEQNSLAPNANYVAGTSLRATRDDAAALRAIRTTSANGAAGNGTVFRYTPLAGADGTRYGLFIRDAIPLENDNGLLPQGTY